MSNKVHCKTQNVYKLSHMYKPVMIILLICGYDLNIKNGFLYSFIAKFYCVSLVLVVIYSSLECCPKDLSQLWSLFEYTASVMVILLFRSRTEKFFKMLKDIDSYLRINKRRHIHSIYKIIVLSIVTWSLRISYTVMYCCIYACYDNLVLYVIRQFSLIGLDFNRVWRCIMFDAVRYRLKLLRIRLEEFPECNYYLYVNNNKSIKENKLKFCLFVYRHIADMVDVISPELHASLFLSVAGSAPKLITNVYHILTAIEGREPVESLGYVIMHVVQISLLLFSPFLIVEHYSVEVEKMRLFLMHRLIDGNDPTLKEDIETFIQYTHVRTFKFRIWRIIPINMSLPLELINMCVTYVIVVINFTHLYG
ncbi:uncharacterized protein LOC126053943 [Helicoverpa armigera]|uniref:uncharacterized protein LOC126053943 n=1 Tax=Helicoverpa armigera TaxID=29058 RepID=UPI003082A5BB